MAFFVLLINFGWLLINLKSWSKNANHFEKSIFIAAVLTYKVDHGLVVSYLSHFTGVADLPSRRSLRSVSTNRLAVPISRLSTVGSRAFLSLALRPGMTSRKTWRQQNHWPHFVASPRHICSRSLFMTTYWTSLVDIAVVPLSEWISRFLMAHISTLRLYSAIHVGSRWKIQDRRQITRQTHYTN